MIGYVTIGVSDMESGKAFYAALLEDMGATVIVGIPIGVSLRIKVTRSQQTYLFPIQLADEV